MINLKFKEVNWMKINKILLFYKSNNFQYLYKRDNQQNLIINYIKTTAFI